MIAPRDQVVAVLGFRAAAEPTAGMRAGRPSQTVRPAEPIVFYRETNLRSGEADILQQVVRHRQHLATGAAMSGAATRSRHKGEDSGRQPLDADTACGGRRRTRFHAPLHGSSWT